MKRRLRLVDTGVRLIHATPEARAQDERIRREQIAKTALREQQVAATQEDTLAPVVNLDAYRAQPVTTTDSEVDHRQQEARKAIEDYHGRAA